MKRPSLYWLLALVPASLVLRALGHDLAVFVTSVLAIIPLAGLMGRATENLAHHLGPGVGGLLNATFGNAAELIIALLALANGKVDLVKASITGSIIGNILLVLGLAMLLGGFRHRRQTFNATAAGMGGTLLTLASIGLIIPTVAAFFYRFFGSSVLTYRVPAALLAVLDVGLLYLLMRRAAGRTAGLFAGLVLLILPLHLFYARTELVVIFSSVLMTVLT